MKRKLLLVIVTSTMLLTGCQNKEEKVNIKNELIKVAKSEEKFRSESYEANYLNKFRIYDVDKIEVEKYVFMNLDKDKEDELVIYPKSETGFYIMLDYTKKGVYMYEAPSTNMQELKEDGTFKMNSEENSTGIYRYDFSEKESNYERITYGNDANELYFISDNVCTKEEYLKKLEEFNKKKNVKWIESSEIK